MSNCKHPADRRKEIAERCYTGAVSRDENRAAHGCITVLVECGACGWRRYENRNQQHEEIGPWFDAPAQARQEEAAAKAAMTEQQEVAAAAGEAKRRLANAGRNGQLVTSGEGGGFVAILRLRSGEEVVVGGGATRAAALRDAAENADLPVFDGLPT